MCQQRVKLLAIGISHACALWPKAVLRTIPDVSFPELPLGREFLSTQKMKEVDSGKLERHQVSPRTNATVAMNLIVTTLGEEGLALGTHHGAPATNSIS